MSNILIGANIILILGSIGWIVAEPKNFEPYLFLIALLIALIPSYTYYKKISVLQANSCVKIPISEIDKKFSSLKKISLVGKNNVGKTTLIENICRIKNKNLVTQGTGAYIVNFSNTLNKFVAILDASGQSQSLQNDIALDSEILIVFLDHNDNNLKRSLSNERLKEEEFFLSLLTERLKTKKHKIEWIHVLINKKDIWGKLKPQVKNKFKLWSQSQIETLRDDLYPIEVTFSEHSNTTASNCTEVFNLISKKI